MALRFLHLADLHLETAFGGRPATRTRLRAATLEAFERGVRLALDERLDAVLIAGDAYDDPELSRKTELLLTRGLRRLGEAGVHVLWCAGNHDPGGAQLRLARMGLEDTEAADAADWRSRIHLFRSVRPRTVQLHDPGGELRGVVVGAGHPADREERNLTEAMTPLQADVPVVGLLHTQVEAARGATEHRPYAPCTREDLARLAYDYYALGHVHQRQQPFSDLPAWYAGNLQGRNPRETGLKGGLLVELEAGQPAEPRFVPLSPVRWERLLVDSLETETSLEALTETLSKRIDAELEAIDSELCVRLVLSGPCPAAAALLSAESQAAIEDELMDRSGAVEVQLRTRDLFVPRDLEEIRATPSVLARAIAWCETLEREPERVAELLSGDLKGLNSEDADDPERKAAYFAELSAGLREDLLRRALKAEESA